MENENLEDRVLHKRKSNSKKIFLIIAGLLVLGVVSLYGGIKILANYSISADTDEPPIPTDPYSEISPTASASPVPSMVVSVTATASAESEPPKPSEPSGPSISVNVPAGWSMISGETLNGRDSSAFGKAGMFVYSFNDPVIPNRDWIISNPDFTNQADYFSITSSVRFWAHPSLGYYVYNPGNAIDLELSSLTSTTRPDSSLIFGRGWHMLYWPGNAASKETLLKNYNVTYAASNTASETASFSSVMGADVHKMSVKVYVVVSQTGIATGSVKELTGTDSDTTISKIPAKSYFWVYLRRTKNRAMNLLYAPAATTSATATSSTTATTTVTAGATSTDDDVLVPPVPTY